MYHSIIHGLVIRDSSETANSQNPLGSGLRQCYDFWVRPRSYAATKPKARSPMGFLLCAARLVSSWAAWRIRDTHLATWVTGVYGKSIFKLQVAQLASAYTNKPSQSDDWPQLLTNLLPVPHTTARACMGRVGVNTERDDSANTENKALHGACGVGRAAQSTNEPSKADIRGVGTYAQSSQLLKSSGFDSVFCVSSSKVGAGMHGDQPTHALVGVARMIYGKKDNHIAEKLKLQGDDFLKSIAWKELRRAVVKTYGRKCMRCGHTPKDPRKTNVDHIRPRKTHPELALSFDNLQVLCSHCNKSKGNKWVKDYRSNPWQNYV